MNGFYGFMHHAEQRGDGLLPELRALTTNRASLAQAANVIDFLEAANRPMQAGANPVSKLPRELPDNVVAFRPPVVAKTPRRQRTAAGRLPRKGSTPRLSNRKS